MRYNSLLFTENPVFATSEKVKKKKNNVIVLPVDIIEEVLPAVLGIQDEISGACQFTGLLSSVLFKK